MKRLLVRVARRLGLLGPFERLHRIETSVEKLHRIETSVEKLHRIETSVEELRASLVGLHEKADRSVVDMQILLVRLHETADGIRGNLDRIELRVISEVVEAVAMEVNRLDNYLVHHVAMLEAAIRLSRREGATAAAVAEIGPKLEEIGSKLEAEVDRLDGNIVHHVALLRALGERAATTQAGTYD